uniref:epithelial cell-transforming sequence 2 oncogene-like n=1 Tax=Pristiophorus japonicus TaxID=55135 RepID=UPI00398E368E
METLASQKVPSPMMALFASLRPTLGGSRRWELESWGRHPGESQPIDRESSPKVAGINRQTRFSSWTPVIHKAANQQLFDERVTLVSHWFDLWTDKQRKRFIHSILLRCSKSQLKFARDWFTETIPLAKLDFTTALPRFLSLYVLSFLNPRELCSASRASWHWRFLTEQDCLWMPKCVKRGWFLPYTPPDHEYGAWKRHYVACACSLDYLTPMEAANIYGVLEEPKEVVEEREDRWKERLLRRLIQDSLARQKKELLRSRPPWLSGKWNARRHNTRLHVGTSQTSPEQSRMNSTLPRLMVIPVSMKLLDCPKNPTGSLRSFREGNLHMYTFMYTHTCQCTGSQTHMVQHWFFNSNMYMVYTCAIVELTETFSYLDLFQDKNAQSIVTLSQLLSEESKYWALCNPALEKQRVLGSLRALCTRKNLAGGGAYPAFPRGKAVNDSSDKLRVVLISSRVPAWEMVLDCVKIGVIPVVYEHSGTTLDSLLNRLEKVLRGQRAKSIGIVAEGDSSEVDLVQGCKISSRNLPEAKIRGFWENLGGCALPQEDGGHIDIFVPLAASEAGMELLSQLSALTALCYSAPTGIVTGSYQHILSEWLWEREDPAPPAIYFNKEKLQAWSRTAQVQEEVLRTVRRQMRPFFRRLQRDVCGRMSGQLMFDSMSAAKVQDHQETTRALTEGLIIMSREKRENPLEFLSDFLVSRSGKSKLSKAGETFLTECDGGISPVKEGKVAEAGSVGHASWHLQGREETIQELSHPNTRLLGDFVEKRMQIARETLSSERDYVQTLEMVKDLYWAPLRAALASNRAILSTANIHSIFSDILSILDLNRDLLGAMTDRLGEWGPSQCLGDVFVKFSTRLTHYTNFFNNYGAILKTIDKCRNTIPGFRAFLARHDRTAMTKMLSLQEALLSPSERFEEYVTLLYALRLHTPAEHADRHHLTAAIADLKCFRDYIRQLKVRSERDRQIAEAQRSIAGAPILVEANRYLIQVQEVAQMNCLDGKICATFRIYEHISDLSLFLFNDALVFASRTISHLPFERSPKTSLQFLASVALSRLLVEDVPDSKYVQNTFVLQGPKRQWICATETEEDKATWLSILESAIRAAVAET